MSVKKKLKNYKSFPLSNQMSLHKKNMTITFDPNGKLLKNKN